VKSLVVLIALVYALAAFLELLSLPSCSLVPDPRPSGQVVVACWNVDNLFDEVADGGEYPEFDPARGWTRAQFWLRCDALGRVIRTLGDRGPDILVLEEVENGRTAAVLADRFLPDLGYHHRFQAPDAVPGIKTVVFSRFPLVRTGLFYPPSFDAGDPLRPLVEAEFDLGGRSLVVIGNHWKSRIPSPRATEGLRRESARLLARRIAALDARADHPLVVAAGDFNTSLELSRPWADRALVPAGSADPGEPALAVYARRRAAASAVQPGAVWDPWEGVSDPGGSYLYQGTWDRLDHLFVSTASLRCPDWTVASFSVRAYAPQPVAYGPRSPEGVSDHFPLVLTLVRR
jgi:endonuclease/exonuclease/phosphatase family metal-dependent hydrolase